VGRWNVVLNADDRYAKQLAVALRSLSEAAASSEYQAFVLQSGFDRELRERVEASCDANVSIVWLDVDDDLVEGVHLSRRLTRASVFRVVAATVLPPDLARVVYLDCDVLVRHPPDELWSMELGGAPVAAVRDAYIPVVCMDVPWRSSGIDPRAPYFNAGVLVVDLDRWRSLDIATRGITLLRDLQLHYVDQSALNILFASQWRALPPTWNLQTNHLADERSRAWGFEDLAELDRAIADPVIVHLNGGRFGRPWEAGSSHPYRDEWYETLDRTAWAGWRPRRTRAADAARRERRAAAVLLERPSG
jgi:lipopolysaccharide biosynthesis glycosyltransferase